MRMELSYSQLKKIISCLFPEIEHGIIEKQRKAVFVYSLLILIVGVTLNLCGIAGPVELFFTIANAIHGISAIVILWLYGSRRISIVAGISIFCIVSQIEISCEMIFSALSNTPYDITLIIANMTLSTIVLFIGVISYLQVVPSIVSTLSLLTYALSIYITKNELLVNFLTVFFLAFGALVLLGRRFIADATKLEQENINLKDEQQEVLNVLHMSREQMDSYMTLSRKKRLKPEDTEQLLQSVGGKTERRIRENVAYYMRQSSIDFESLKRQLPELTHSELEICSLILKEKKLREISEELEKSPSNITCQRTNIRAKLGLEKSDNLHQFLKKRIEMSS